MSLADKKWAQLASSEGVESAEAAREFGVAQAALAVKPAKEVEGGAFSFLRIAFQTARDQVAGEIAAELGEWHDGAKALHSGSQAT
jgi:uncharacterized protein YigA (DUF484 family)